MTGTKSKERVGSSKTSNKKSKADAATITNKQEKPKAGKSNGVAPEPEVLVVPSSSTESQAREPESRRNRSPERRERRDGDPAGNKKRKRRKREEGGESKEERKSSKSNGVATREPEVLVVPSSSTESQGGEREPDRDQSAKMSESVTSSAVRKKRKHQEREDGDEIRDDSKLCSFPMNRIRTIAKSEESDLRINHEAYFVINKATEKFIEQLCEDAYALPAARDRDRKKFFKYSHLSSLVCKWKRYDFLSDFVPEKIKAQDAVAESKPEET